MNRSSFSTIGKILLSDNLLDKHEGMFVFIGLFLLPLAVRSCFVPFFELNYDEMSYADTAHRLATQDQWLSAVNTRDLFFFPPLFNYLAGLLCFLGLDRLLAVRTISVVFSSGIAPLLYYLARRFDYTRRASVFAAVLFIIAPYSFYYSAIGMVEMMMIFFIVLSLFLFCRSLSCTSEMQCTSTPTFLLSAVALGAAIWTKETALGLIPVYLVLLRRKPLLLIKWGAVFLVSISPLILYSMSSRRYGLVSEIPLGQFAFKNWNADIIIRRLFKIMGGDITVYRSFGLLTTLWFAYLLIRSFATLTRDRLKRDILLRFSVISLAIYAIFFVVFKKKFEHHTLLVFLFCLSPMAIYLDRTNRIVRTATIGLIGLSLMISSSNSCRLFKSRDYIIALKDIERTSAGARVFMPMPNIAEYLHSKKKRDLTIVNYGDILREGLSLKQTWQKMLQVRFDFVLVQRYWAARNRITLKNKYEFPPRRGMPGHMYRRVKSYGHLVLYKLVTGSPPARSYRRMGTRSRSLAFATPIAVSAPP